MKHARRAQGAALVVVLCLGAPHATPSAQSAPAAPSGAYEKAADWPKLPSGLSFETCKDGVCQTPVIGILPDGSGNVWILARLPTPIIKLDPAGRVITSFGEGLFVNPHGFCMDAAGALWAGDSGVSAPNTPPKGAQFHKFSQDGTRLMSLGQAGVSKVSPETFLGPTACVVAANGDIIVADGHIPRAISEGEGDRLVRFSRDGMFIQAIGKTGSGPGEFRGPHALAFDSQGRLFVADRSNSRIQVFDKNLKFAAEWRQFGRPSALVVLPDDTLIVSDFETGGPVAWPDQPGESSVRSGVTTGVRNPGFTGRARSRTYGPDTTLVHVGRARDGSVQAEFEAPRSEALGADLRGAIYTGPAKYLARQGSK